MATGKRYFWIKLRESFLTSDTVDFLMEQPDGADYVVLYQMLCLKTINTNGVLSRQIGEIVIPYDVKKIQRDCKWFSLDTVRVAMGLFKQLGLVYEQNDGTLQISDYERLIGSETDYANQKRIQRDLKGVDNVHSLSTQMSIQSKRIEKEIDISSSATRAREHSETDDVEKLNVWHGTETEGLLISKEQFDDLCERLTLDEIDHYCEVIKRQVEKGHHYGKSHYQAILDMVAHDRELGEEV